MKYLIVFFTLGSSLISISQESLTLQDCEDLFLKNNLQLLAEQYNIDASKAAEMQAKIWDRPVLSGELNAYNPDANKVFDIGSQGQKAFQLEQLITLGGKRRKEVDFARSNTAIAELQYEQLLRNLRFQLHQSFYSIYFDQQKMTGINKRLNGLDSLVQAYSVQVQKGNLPMKDLVRLQALSASFRSDLISIQQTINDQQTILKILTNSATSIVPKADPAVLENANTRTFSNQTGELQQTALANNPEYLTYQKISESEQLKLKWQQSLNVPDLNLGAAYDQRGGAFNNQLNLTFAIDLPLWNKNKGNIKLAEAQLAQSKTMEQQKAIELSSQVENAYTMLLYQQEQYRKTYQNPNNLETVYEGILHNFQKQNISLIEFTDFMESYVDNVVLSNEMKKQLTINRELLNYLLNTNIF